MNTQHEQFACFPNDDPPLNAVDGLARVHAEHRAALVCEGVDPFHAGRLSLSDVVTALHECLRDGGPLAVTLDRSYACRYLFEMATTWAPAESSATPLAFVAVAVYRSQLDQASPLSVQALDELLWGIVARSKKDTAFEMAADIVLEAADALERALVDAAIDAAQDFDNSMLLDVASDAWALHGQATTCVCSFIQSARRIRNLPSATFYSAYVD